LRVSPTQDQVAQEANQSMPVPTYDKFIEPVLRYLAAHAEGAPAREVHDAAATALALSEAERDEVLPSGSQRIYKNRAGWAHDRLKRAGYSASLRRGYWQITAAGQSFASKHPAPLASEEVQAIADLGEESRVGGTSSSGDVELHPVTSERATAAVSSPDDRLEAAVAELRASIAADLLETLGQVSPDFFETIVLDVLHKVGYGTSRSDLKRVGRSGDGGIDGAISLDRLGLERVYVQAKRWKGVVGRPDIQAFYGALAGQHVTKGIFITTSSFTAQAVEFVKSLEHIVLVNGAKLAELMIEHEVGVSMRPVRVPKLNEDYFAEDE
jgi:restriction system protein